MAFQISISLTPEHSEFINNRRKQGTPFSPSDFFRQALQNHIDESLGVTPSKQNLRNELFDTQQELERKVTKFGKALAFIQEKNLSGEFSTYLQKREIDEVDAILKEAKGDVEAK